MTGFVAGCIIIAAVGCLFLAAGAMDKRDGE
jgi:hypothetical protein